MPKGVRTDPRLPVRARELRAEGLEYREIAKRLGVPLRTVGGWCLDPDGKQKRARVLRYGGICELCDGPTDGSKGPGEAPKICQECLEWSEEMIIAAMQEWAEAHGGCPPLAAEWHRATLGYPAASVVRYKGGWNELLLKAGFDLRMDRRTQTQTEMEQMLRGGMSVREVAEHFGWSTSNVYNRLYYRGLHIGDLRRAA
jgi:hypothetical protein